MIASTRVPYARASRRATVIGRKRQRRRTSMTKRRKFRARQIAAGSGARCVQQARAAAERVLQLFEHGFGEASIRRDLAAEDRQQRRMVRRLRELDSIVARDARRALRCVVEERPDAGVRPAHVARRDLTLEVTVDRVAEIADLVVGRCAPAPGRRRTARRSCRPASTSVRRESRTRSGRPGSAA